MNKWTPGEVKIVAEYAYWPVLHAELHGRPIVKSDALREVEAHLPHRTYHSIMDRCYKISEVLRDEGLPWVNGWKPKDMVGQSPNTVGVTAVIRNGALPYLRERLGRM